MVLDWKAIVFQASTNVVSSKYKVGNHYRKDKGDIAASMCFTNIVQEETIT